MRVILTLVVIRCINTWVMAHPIYKTIGMLIKARRKTLQLKQETLASTLGISRGSLANIETGKQSILVHNLYKFAEALKLTPFDLLPHPSDERAGSGGTDLPLPTDLKAVQKQQVADFFLQIDTQKTVKNVSNVKTRTA